MVDTVPINTHRKKQLSRVLCRTPSHIYHMTAELLPIEVWSCLSAHTGLPRKTKFKWNSEFTG